MKYTLLLTQRCNLACTYCYIGQRASRMSTDVADAIVDFAFRTTPPSERIDIGFFGGEPLLEFDTLTEVVARIEQHAGFDPSRVLLTVVSNGTVFSDRIASFLVAHDIAFGISCDGPPEVHDRYRRFRSGRASSPLVERTIRRAIARMGAVMVNAVYRPDTVASLPRTVTYLAQLGVRQIYLTPDHTAGWQATDVGRAEVAFEAVADLYMDAYRRGAPLFIAPLDAKIAVVLRGGYQQLERCRLGRGEFAFTPEGRIYPCERLVGTGDDGHCIGNVRTGIDVRALPCWGAGQQVVNAECAGCGVSRYCMNWCGCSNLFATGACERVGSFICASEKALLRAAVRAFETLTREGVQFPDHAGGMPAANSLVQRV